MQHIPLLIGNPPYHLDSSANRIEPLLEFLTTREPLGSAVAP